MTYTINFSQEDNILIADVAGTLDMPAYISMRNQIREFLEARKLEKILLDLSHARVKVSFIDIYTAASTNIAVFPSIRKYAIVYSADTLKEESILFGETVAKNRGSNFRVFSEIGPAKEWLAGSES